MRAGNVRKLESIWHVSGLTGDWQFLALSPVAGAVGASLRLRVAQDTELSFVGEGAEACVVENRPLGVPVSTPIAARLRPNATMTVVVDGAAERFVALEAPAPGRPSHGESGTPRLAVR